MSNNNVIPWATIILVNFDFSVNYEQMPIFKSYPTIYKKTEKLNLIFQKLDHLTCIKIP